jgi:hypothetical protein
MCNCNVCVSFSIGAWGGMLPAPGFTTLMTIFLVQVVVPWKFTAPMKALSIAVNMVISPIKYMALPLFIYGGTFALGGIKCDPVTIFKKFHDPKMSFLGAVGDSSSCIFGGILVWAVLAIPMVVVLNSCIVYITGPRDSKQKES